MSHRVLTLPRVWMSPDPEKVCVRVPDDPGYFEIMLTPDEAENFIVDLMVDMRRAKAAVRSGHWVRRIKVREGTESPDVN